MGYIEIGCRSLLALVFLSALAGKVRSRTAVEEFVMAVRTMRVVPDGLVRQVATTVIIGEAAVPVLVLVPATAMIGAAVALVLLASFMVAVERAHRRGIRQPCRCFGTGGSQSRLAHLARNLLLVGIAVLALAAGGADVHHPGGVALAVVGAAVVAALVIRMDDLVGLFRATAPAKEYRSR